MSTTFAGCGTMFAMLPSSHPAPWSIIVPVKGTSEAKSRLDVASHQRPRFARAFALDALDAVVAYGQAGSGIDLVVTTSDASLAEDVPAARVLCDVGGGLNAAIAAALAQVSEDRPRAVLLADLPALTPDQVRAALEAAHAHDKAFVPDHGGTGTVLLTARAGVRLVPRFGAGSAAAHEDAGHVRLDLDLPGLRTDVDDLASLEAVTALGVGPHTRAALLGRS